MALQSVATLADSLSVSGSKHALWIGGGHVLTIAIDKSCKEFPPEPAQRQKLSIMIQGLARAAKSVVYHAENDPGQTAEFAMQPIEDIADAIVLLSQLSDAVAEEVGWP